MKFRPMMAKIGTKDVLTIDGFIFELKLDGVRSMCHKKGDELQFFSRNGLTITKKYPEFSFADSIKAKNCVLDGEIVIYDEEGNPSFQLWQDRNSGEDHTANYVVFDILEKDGKDLTDLPLSQRKKILEETITETERLQTSPAISDGKKLWDVAQKRHLEGVIAKKADSVYEEGRSDSWLKVKQTKTIDCVIVGYTKMKRALSSLALGIYEKDTLIFIGKVGTGFSDQFLDAFKKDLEQNEIKKEIIEDIPDDVISVQPIFVAEIKYHVVTKDKKLRAPVFVRLREDKDAHDCSW